jgi:hypothetical protein
MNLNILRPVFSFSLIFVLISEGKTQIPEQEISHVAPSNVGNRSSGFLSPLIHKVKYAAQMNSHDIEHGLSSYYINGGLSNYYGDLCRGANSFSFRPGFGAGYIYRWDKRVSIRTEFNYYRLYARDYYEQRNFTFRSGNMELYSALTYDIIPFSIKYQYRHTIIPYIFGGFGITRFNPKGKYEGHWYALEPLRTEGKGYSRFSPIIPFGGGLRIKCLSGVDVMIEVGFRKTFTDHLDDVSSHEFQPVNSFSNPVASALSNQSGMGDSYTQYRGNPHKKDMYAISQLKIVYTPKGRFLMKRMNQSLNK